MVNDSIKIDLSLNNVWHSWSQFRRGKKSTVELENFQYHLEDNLWRLQFDLIENKYQHGDYRHFTIKDTKIRDIAVASIRDRVVHRLVYEYLVQIFDHTFIYDAWSCRQNKGQIGAIKRTHEFFTRYHQGYFWRADIKKFFDNVDCKILVEIILRKITDEPARRLIERIIYGRDGRLSTGAKGIPIGNLTSQIFANIYLNELDRYMKNILKPCFYLRYGDDFIAITKSWDKACCVQKAVKRFLSERLDLEINPKHDIIIPVRRGARFLGVEIYPTGWRLKKKIWQRAQKKLNCQNIASYHGLIKKNYNKKITNFNWLILKLYE